MRGASARWEAGCWPLLALGISSILSLVWLIGNLRRYAREKEGHPEELPTPEAVAAAWGMRKKIALCGICLLVYIVAIPWIGFLLSTVLFILAFILALEEKRRLGLIISPLLITAVVILIFASSS